MPERGEPTDPKRVKAFARFFKNYMSIWSVVTASLPIPVTALGVIPTYKVHTTMLSTYTPLFCFLILGFIFYSRHQLARLMFPEHFGGVLAFSKINLGRFFLTPVRITWSALIALLPVALIAASLFCVFQYHDLLGKSIREGKGTENIKQRALRGPGMKYEHDITDSFVLENSHQDEVRDSSSLMVYYLAIFLTAEAAFILMAIKEYLQDLVGLTEIELIAGPESRAP